MFFVNSGNDKMDLFYLMPRSGFYDTGGRNLQTLANAKANTSLNANSEDFVKAKTKWIKLFTDNSEILIYSLEWNENGSETKMFCGIKAFSGNVGENNLLFAQLKQPNIKVFFWHHFQCFHLILDFYGVGVSKYLSNLHSVANAKAKTSISANSISSVEAETH